MITKFLMRRTNNEINLFSSSLSTIDKEWGSEQPLNIDSCYGYNAKLMTVHPNKICSVHYHLDKTESFIVVKGQLVVELFDKTGTKHVVKLNEFEALNVLKNTPHTFYTPDGQTESTIFVEVSTPDDPEDSYRLTKSGPRKS